MIKWLLNQLDKHGRKSIIMDRENNDPYLERYYIAWPDSVKRERKDIPFNVFIHRFMQNDDPVFHNHPWDWYFTFILKGGYWEHTPWGVRWRGPGTWKFQRGNEFFYLKDPRVRALKSHDILESGNRLEHEYSRKLPKGYGFTSAIYGGNPLLHSDLHWVEIPKPGETWTLFIRGNTFGDWGFVPDINTGKWIQYEKYLSEHRKKAK